MYEEGEFRVDWLAKFKKAFIIILILASIAIIFILFFNNKEQHFNDYFEDNINTMSKVAQNYYSHNKDYQKITLKEMLDRKMILDFVDEDGTTCDLNASYANIESNKVKVFLKCNQKEETRESII